MGNEITTIAPSQLQPIESYFAGDERFSNIHSLSSTRFFKTVRCTHRGGGEAVVKVLAKYDLPVQYSKTYRPVLLDLKEKLASVPNALAYADFWETDKAAYLLRQHVRHSLYDLLSVRPALSTVEKKWIAFQLLRALKDSHEKKCFHGDIKSENVLVTGWNWVFLSDYAPFKPTELPMDDPGDYDFYFDTARRRTCYIAPERFIDPTERSPEPQAKLTESMDLFSLGCVIAEMFSDGRQVFDLSHLLEYRRQQLRPPLRWIKNEDIRDLVQSMIQPNTEEQYSAAEILHIHSGHVFPAYFETFLHSYMQAVTYGDENGPIRPDLLIQRLHDDLETALANVAFSQSEDLGDRESGYGDGLVIVLSAVTSHMQVLQLSSSKIKALNMLKSISHHIRDDFILDRVVPYLMHCVGDPMATVKVEAIRTLTHCLGMIHKLVKSDVNLFQDYILPGLANIPDDPRVSVRLALADCIADLAESAHRFLEIALHDASQTVDEDYLTLGSYDSELALLRSQVAQRVASFLSDPDNAVKKMVMKHLKKLCIFFGFQQANDVILGHMITYLNDKGDWQLHNCFFECIVGVVAYLGWPAVCLVEPLLLQGLKDPEETVISKAVDAITGMCSLKLFDMPKMLEFVDHIRPLLFHPNIWIRYSAVGFVCGTAQEMGDIDTACFLSPRLESYLRQPVMDLSNHYLLLSTLKDPLLRPVYDYVLKQSNLQEFFDCLIERRSTRELSRPGYEVKYPPLSARFEPRFRRLQFMGLDSQNEDKLIELQHVILSVQAGRLFSADVPVCNGMHDLSDLNVTGSTVSFDTLDEQWFKEPNDPAAVAIETRGQTASEQRRTTKSDEVDEWNLMFSDDPPSRLKAASSSAKTSAPDSHVLASRSVAASLRGPHPSPSVTPGMWATQDAAAVLSLLDIEQNLPSGDIRGNMRGRRGRHKRSKSDTNTLVQSRWYGTELSVVEGRHPGASQAESTCHNALEALIQHKIQQHKSGRASLRGQQQREKAFFRVKSWGADSGVGTLKLVSHLQEHKSAINRIRVSTDNSAAATFSNDGTFKVWNTQNLDQQPFILKSSFNYSKLTGQIRAGVFCNSTSKVVAAGSSEGVIHAVNVEHKDKPILTWPGTAEGNGQVADGAIVEMHCLDEQGPQNIICYATSMGRVHGMDIRVGQPVWTVQQEYKTGLLTAMAIDPEQNWVATGTSCGQITVWDVRFQLPINSWLYCDDNLIGPVYRLMPHPQHPHLLLSAVEGNNEVSAWNMETGQKKLMLWGVSQVPPFSRSSKECRNTSVRALCCGAVDRDPVVLTGGTDRRVRMWNLRQPSLSSCVLAPSGVRRGDVAYKYQMIEGVEVIAEVESVGAQPTEDPPGVPHMDIITDLAVAVRGVHPFLLSASYNGELKIWR